MSSLLANQATLADLSKKFDGRIPVRIHFLDNSSKVFLVGGEITVKDLLTQCLLKLGVAEAEVVLPYFGLFESKNGGSIDGVLAMEVTIESVLQSWQKSGVDKTAKFLFMIRLQVPTLWGLQPKDVVANSLGLEEQDLPLSDYFNSAELIDSNALHLQFIQAVYNIITGRYPTSQEEGLTLGAIHFILKFGRYRGEKHKPGFLGNRIMEFVPIKLLKSSISGGKGSDTLAAWEAQLMEKVKSMSAECVEDPKYRSSKQDDEEVEEAGDEHQFVVFQIENSGGTRLVPPERRYMEIVYAMSPLFGSTFYRCTQKSARLPDVINLGIHCEGIHLFDKSKKHLKTFYIQEILRWGFKPNQMFYFEVNPDNEYGIGSFEFDTNEGKAISDLMTDYAMAFLKERERAEGRMVHFQPVVRSKRPQQSRSTLRNGSSTDEMKNLAATKIQALFRGYFLRVEWIREDAAILIQSIFRGYRARILLSLMIEQMIKDGQL